MTHLWIVHHLLLLLLDLVKKELIWATLMILLKVKERPFDAEVGRVLLAQNVQNLGLVVDSIVNDRRGHQLAPCRGQLNRLLPNLLYFSQVKVILRDDEAQVDQVI